MTNLKLIENAFVDEGLNPEKLFLKLKKGKVLNNFYMVVYNNRKLEIINSRLFLMKYYRNQCYDVCALVKEYDDALEYIRCLVELSYKHFKDFIPIEAISNIELNELKGIYYEGATI